jgi:hypothetical protein
LQKSNVQEGYRGENFKASAANKSAANRAEMGNKLGIGK